MNPYWTNIKPRHLSIWKKDKNTGDLIKNELEDSQYTLYGYSVAANETGFWIPELRMMLDCGVISKHTPETIFITHGHMDHSGQIHKTIIDVGVVKPIIYAPMSITPMIKATIDAFYILSTNNITPKIHDKYILEDVKPNTQIHTIIKNKPWLIDVIKCFHTVPTVGYGFIERRKRLLPKYKNLTGQDLCKLKKNGTNIMELYDMPIFCFLGDTYHIILENNITNSVIKKYPTVMIECTFLKDEHIKKAEKTRHMHWKFLYPFIKNNTQQEFILYHFSAIYTFDEINIFFRSYREKDSDNYLPNMILWHGRSLENGKKEDE